MAREVRRQRIGRAFSERCEIILLCADGLDNRQISIQMGIHELTVGKWLRRFVEARLEGLYDEPRPGRPRAITDDEVAAVIERSLRSTPTVRPIGRSAQWPGR